MNRVVQSLAPALAALVAVAAAAPAEARDRLRIVGSSTIFPYTVAVADAFAADGRFPRPDVESTGTGGGFRQFCAGSGLDTPDITGASRPMTRAEWELCRAGGVWPITQVPIGYDGLTVVVAKAFPADLALTRGDIYTALAARVSVDGQLVDNPHRTWSDVRAGLPDVPIAVIGPPPSSGTRDSFVELALHEGCRGDPMLAGLEASDRAAWLAACTTIRTDGAFVEAGEDDEAIVADVAASPGTLGILGYGYLSRHADTLRAVPVDGVSPDPVTIARLAYPLARPLYLYLKNQHEAEVPGMTEFVQEYVRGMGPDGYLAALGLVFHFDFADFEQVAGDAIDGTPMVPPTQ